MSITTKATLETYLELVEDEENWVRDTTIEVTPKFLALLIRLAIAVDGTSASYDDRDPVFGAYWNLGRWLYDERVTT